MSAESERVFSGARRTITWERHSLGSEVVEQSECMKSWLKLLAQDGEGVISSRIAQEILDGTEPGDAVESLVSTQGLEAALGVQLGVSSTTG
jgi:hypothetical protein